MNCPACSRELQQVKLNTITVDACQGGCGGIWFDTFELQKVDNLNEVEGEPLLKIQKDQNVKVDQSVKRSCPKCHMIMMQHFSNVDRKVTVDECPKCGGYWLDSGELGQIRSSFKTEAEREQSVNKYFNDVFGAQLKKDHDEYEAKFQKIQKASKLFSFICPSRYLGRK